MDERRNFTSFSTVFQSYQDARDENKSCVQWNPLMIEKMSVSSRAHTLNRQISRPALSQLSYGALICAKRKKMKSAKTLGQTDQNLHTLF